MDRIIVLIRTADFLTDLLTNFLTDILAVFLMDFLTDFWRIFLTFFFLMDKRNWKQMDRIIVLIYTSKCIENYRLDQTSYILRRKQGLSFSFWFPCLTPLGLAFCALRKYFLIKINGILLPKLFWPTVRKKCSSDREKFWDH